MSDRSVRWRVLDLDGWAFARPGDDRWSPDAPQLHLVYEADDDETVSIIEQAAEDAGIELERIQP